VEVYEMLFENDQDFIDRFVAACQTDDRVLAATIWGSHVSGAADRHSDLDIGLITADDGYRSFVSARYDFVRLFGEPAFLEDFGSLNMVFFIFPNGVEGHLSLGSVRQFRGGQLPLFGSPYRILVDKNQILAEAKFPRTHPTPEEQRETLRRSVYWFWHDLSHFVAAWARNQLWWAYGQIEALRRYCVVLARLRHDFSEEPGGEECYEKVDLWLPVEHLSPLKATCCSLESGAILQAVFSIVKYYREVATLLCRTHDIAYPTVLDRVMSERLEKLDG
jgi:predicted nucleotidyltransferase